MSARSGPLRTEQQPTSITARAVAARTDVPFCWPPNGGGHDTAHQQARAEGAGLLVDHWLPCVVGWVRGGSAFPASRSFQFRMVLKPRKNVPWVCHRQNG